MTTSTIDRKTLAQALAEELGTEARYLGVPSCAYRVGDYTINRDGTVDGDLEAIRDFLISHGIIQEEPDAEIEESEQEVVLEGEPEPVFESNVDTTELSVPCNDLTPQQMINLIRILYSRQKLLAIMLKNDKIQMDKELVELIELEKPDTTFRIFELTQHKVATRMLTGMNVTDQVFMLAISGTDHSVDLTTYVRLMAALLTRAKEAGFVSAKLIDPAEGEMKYYVNSFLNQLGFGGVEHKNDRAVLMSHIKGYAAFKNSTQMDRHKARLKERRQASKHTAPTDSEAGDTE